MACQSTALTRSDVCSTRHRTFPAGCSPCAWFFGSIARRHVSPLSGQRHQALSGGLWLPRALSACRPSLLAPSCARCGISPLLRWGDWKSARPQRGCHVPHRQAALGELASRRRERGTVSADQLTSADHAPSQDVSTPFVPSLRYDASIEASRVFNSIPAFPRIDVQVWFPTVFLHLRPA